MGLGKFIAIEGPDASGKGTQQKLLVNHLLSINIPVETVDFPQYESSLFGELVGQMLNGEMGDMNNIHPKVASVIYASDRFKKSEYIKGKLEKGINIVANRYTLSNTAHQSARLPREEREEFIYWLHRMEYEEEGFNIPKPDLYICLDVPIEITQELLLKKAERSYLGGSSKDALEADVLHQLEAAKMYLSLAETLPGIVTIKCAPFGELLSESEIHKVLWEESCKVLSPELKEGAIRGERG